jgi:cytochrome P450
LSFPHEHHHSVSPQTTLGRTPLYGPEFAEDPHGVYARLRQSHGSVAPVELAPGVDAHLVVGYETALQVLREPDTFPKNARVWQQSVPQDCPVLPMMMYRPNLLFEDGAQRARLRQAMTDSLERLDPHDLRSWVEEGADTLINQFAAEGSTELIGSYCMRLQMLVFTRLVGCPEHLAGPLLEGLSGIYDAGSDAERANTLLGESLMALAAHRRAHPGQDVASWMATHSANLSDEELAHQCVAIMGGAVEPGANLIALAVRLLLSDARFAGNLASGSTPVQDALDEVLWHDAPLANFGTVFPPTDVMLDGVRCPAHKPVLVSFAAANNDPSLRDPSLGDGQRSGNRSHLAYGAGTHSCPGQSQARLIASVAVETLMDRLPEMRLAVPADELTWRPGPFHRALTALPVRFPPAAVPNRSDDPYGGTSWSTPGALSWTPPPPSPTSSTPPGGTSTPRTAGSGPAGPRRWWSSLATWWRGR